MFLCFLVLLLHWIELFGILFECLRYTQVECFVILTLAVYYHVSSAHIVKTFLSTLTPGPPPPPSPPTTPPPTAPHPLNLLLSLHLILLNLSPPSSKKDASILFPSPLACTFILYTPSQQHSFDALLPFKSILTVYNFTPVLDLWLVLVHYFHHRNNSKSLGWSCAVSLWVGYLPLFMITFQNILSKLLLFN